MRFAICFPGFPFSSVQTLSLWLMSPFAMPRRKLLFRARPRRTTFRVGPQPPCSPGREANLIPLRQRMDGCIAPFRIALLIDETVFDQKRNRPRNLLSRHSQIIRNLSYGHLPKGFKGKQDFHLGLRQDPTRQNKLIVIVLLASARTGTMNQIGGSIGTALSISLSAVG